MRFSTILGRSALGSAVIFIAAGVPLARSVHADASINTKSSLLLTCHSKPVVLQGHHLDGSIDPSSVLHVTMTYCEGSVPSMQTNNPLLTLNRLRSARSSTRLADWRGNQDPLGPGGNGCGYGVQGDANGTANSGSAYAHYYYVNPNDGQTIDYASINVAYSNGQFYSGLSAPSNISYTSVAVYYTQQNSPWSITKAYCGPTQL